MSFRTVVVENRCKLEYSLNYMVCRKTEETIRVCIDEIKTLVINSLQVSITTSLISELIKRKVKMIFIDSEHNPAGEIVPYQNNFYSYRKIKEQMKITNDVKGYLWQQIIKKKIENQAYNLEYINKQKEYLKLLDYMNNVMVDDETNREGHSAKVYFNSLF